MPLVGREFVAVLDVGKTNKKFVVYNSDFNVVESRSARIGEVKLNSLLCDDAGAIVKWARATTSEWWGQLSAVAVTTHGATLALLDASGELVMPIVSYNQEVGDEVKESFYREFGSPEELYAETGTPPLGQLLNAGVQLYWIARRFPEKYSRVRRILFLPQFLAYALSKLEAAELTSIGCHTYLWDLVEGAWSSVAAGLEVPSKSPEVRSVWEPLGEVEGTLITAGIHDSNAALLPYVTTEREEFTLASTGTWCVLMYPGAPFSPSLDDMRMDVLYYVDAYGRPVKAARFKCGYEFDCYVEEIKRAFGVNPLSIGLDWNLAACTLSEGEAFFIPTLTLGTGQFPLSRGRVVGPLRDAVRAYYYLNLSLAVQTWYALRLLTGGRGVKAYVQGGFARNEVYLAYLATLAPWAEVIRAEYPEATSLGAALTALCALEGVEPRELGVDLSMIKGRRVEPLEVREGVADAYVEKFLSLCSS